MVDTYQQRKKELPSFHSKVLSRRSFFLLSTLIALPLSACSDMFHPYTTFNATTHTPTIPFATKPVSLDNVEMLTQLASFGSGGALAKGLGVTWAPDGQIFAVGDASAEVLLRDTRTGNLQATLEETHQDEIWGVAWSPDGSLLAGASSSGIVSLWNAKKHVLHTSLSTDSPWAFCVAWSPDMKQIVAGTLNGTICRWDARTNIQLTSMEHTLTSGLQAKLTVLAVAFSPNGKILASSSITGVLHLWDGETGQSLGPALANEPASDMNGLSWSPNGQMLATTNQDGVVRIWNPTTQVKVAELRGHQGWTRGIGWSPNGLLLASSGQDGTIRIWNATSYKLLKVLQTPETQLWSLAWSPDGSLIISGGDDGKTRPWGLHQ